MTTGTLTITKPEPEPKTQAAGAGGRKPPTTRIATGFPDDEDSIPEPSDNGYNPDYRNTLLPNEKPKKWYEKVSARILGVK